MQYNAFVTIECRIVHQLTKIRRQNLASGFKRGGVSKLIKFDTPPYSSRMARMLSEWEVVGVA